MKFSFEELFIDPVSDRSLSLDYLEKNKFISKPIIDGFNLDDLEYFDTITKKEHGEGYRLHHAEWGQAEKIEIFNNLSDLFIFYNKIDYEDVIIKFNGKRLFIWTEDIDCYVIFGAPDLVKKIDKYDYNYDYSMNRIEKKGNQKDIFLDFYNKYNVSF